ncbi:MAG TPA: bifunctional phosphoribosyl-AMP cyclohydrolase/phosphoribosyl-ATP diphosphatase HisIE [Gemmatimonadaceae bacterium]|jgi:phosphoribosyl-ATP pyrophosphohydrolase/phosphoribosyl-AMP cyclohydrolase
MMLDIEALDFNKGGGLVTVVTQDALSGGVLMVAHADREALEKTVDTREMHYHSRTRGLWRKGSTSGNIQRVVSLTADCDGDSVLARVTVAGPACHTGGMSCFGEESLSADAFSRLDAVIQSRAAELQSPPTGESETRDARASYTQRLLRDRNLRLKKIGEEAAEFVTACADDDRARAVDEAADLVYHIMVALQPLGAGQNDIREALRKRAK